MKVTAAYHDFGQICAELIALYTIMSTNGLCRCNGAVDSVGLIGQSFCLQSGTQICYGHIVPV